jgi:uncharacterized membrane protein YgcG
VLSVLALLLLQNCQKDIHQIDLNQQKNITKKYNLTIDEAKSYFNSLQTSSNQSSLNGSGTQVHFFDQVAPLWNEAFISSSQSGNQMVVIPVNDSLVKVLNGGQVGMKLTFSRISPDSIDANLLVYVADTTSNASLASYNFSNFSGLYLFFDVGQHYKYGIYVKDGIPKGAVDTLFQTQRGTITNRNYIPCTMTVAVPCDMALDYCITYVTLQFDCGGGAGPGGNGGSGGGGNGGGGHTGSGGGGTGITFGSSSWLTEIFHNNIPIDLFLAEGGHLPAGLTLDQLKKLLSIHQRLNLTDTKIQWLESHVSVIESLYNFSQAHLGSISASDFMLRMINLIDSIQN